MSGHIGVDESGKGDYFGYLVVAGVVADEALAERLRKMGVRDSKNVSDASIPALAAAIKKSCAFDIVKISPEKYNALHRKFRNLNRLLAWAHARVIENLLAKHDVDFVVVDKFADEKILKGALLENGKKAKIVQRVRAESDMAVAAASILARAEFLRTLRALSLEVGCKLPKGATHVEDAARHLLDNFDEKVLESVAKVHFKTTKKVTKK